jgi:predicted tellurium resistance membrane protein TerC
VAYRLLDEQDAQEHAGPSATTFWAAMKTIVVADALMGIDNVLGVAGAAHGSFDLVIIGLLVSVPIVVFGSSVVLKLVERFPVIIQLGAAVLAFTAAKMMVDEPLLAELFGSRSAAPDTLQTTARWSAYALAILGVLGAGLLRKRRA